MEKFVPVKTIKKRGRPPWVSKKLLQMIKKRNKAFQKMRDSKSDKNTNVFYVLKNQCKEKIRKNYNSHVENTINPDLEQGN